MELLGRVALISIFCICASNAFNSEDFTDRIIGGQIAYRGQFPWQAEIETILNNQTTSYCGGALISRDYVISSAQCIPEGSTIHVLLGAQNITNNDEVGRVDLIADFYFVHPNFTEDTLSNNLVVIHLPRAVMPSPYVSPAVLPPRSDFNDSSNLGLLGRVSGWGADSDGTGNYSTLLRYADIMITDIEECEGQYAAGTVNENHICASTQGARGPCKGDQGNALTVQKLDGSVYQVGIFSFYDEASCITGNPVVFTKLAAHLDWIYDVTGIPPTDEIDEDWE